jgi:hypothetical protein
MARGTLTRAFTIQDPLIARLSCIWISPEVRAQQGLLGVGDGGGGAQFAAGAALGGGQERHDCEGEGGDDDAGDRPFGFPGARERTDGGVHGGVRGEREEGDDDDPQGALFAGFS